MTKQQTGITERKQDLTGDGGEAIAALLNKSSSNALSDNPTANNSEPNILNNYRSVNYHFTLAALTPNNIRDPKSYRDSTLKYIIISTKGKGPNAISSNIVPIKTTKEVTELIFDNGGNEATEIKKIIPGEDDVSGVDIVKGFNKESQGRFEFFIDNLEIDSIVAPTEQSGTSLSTSVRFDVFEQFSVNGFIEALHTTALAAGWTGYLNASFLLKIEFIGYPDNVDLPTPKLINATKYIPIKFTGAEMNVTEQGTTYNCKAIPFNEAGYGNPNEIYTDISFTGNTVKQVLDNLFSIVNKHLEEREKKEKNSDNTKTIRDIYEIYFPNMPELGKDIKIVKNSDGNLIAGKSINNNLRENSLYKFPEKVSTVTGGRGTTQSEQFRLNPQVSRIQFAKDSHITDIITAVIRDSHYLKEILADVNAAKDAHGMIDYFQIIINTLPLGIDTTTNIHKHIYQFLVVPYKVHYTKLPGYQSKKFPAKELLPFVKRTYNYIYTGNNIDVLNFKLNFNHLFFQASNPKMANTDKLEKQDAAASSDNVQVKQPNGLSKDAPESKFDTAGLVANGDSSSFKGRAGAPKTDPYFQLAYNAHRAILESVNLLTAEIDLVGDPYYLSTSGIGNYFARFKQLGLTVDGEATPQFGPVLCRINFRNPVDIDSVTGQYKFSELVPFSGVYQVIKVKHMFTNGIFKQRLNLIRFPGQVDDEIGKKPLPIKYDIESKPGEQSRKDSAPAEVPQQGVKENNIELDKMISRGVPSPAGITGPESSKLNQIAKAAFGVSAVLAGSDLLKGGLKLDVGSIAGLVLAGTGAASLLNQATSVASSLLPSNASSLLNTDVTKSLSETAGAIKTGAANLAAGVSISGQEFLKTANGSSIIDGSGNPILTGAAFLDPAGALSGIKDKIGNITAPTIPGLSGSGGSLTAAQKNAVLADAKTKGIPADQALRNASMFGVNLLGFQSNGGSIAAKLGLDTSALSKLTGVDSKLVDQIKQAAEEIPKNTDLNKAKDQGIIMGSLGVDSFKNLPSIPPFLHAPLAALPNRSVASTLSAEQRTAVIADAKTKGIPVDQALRNASMFGVNLKALSPEAQAIAISNNPQAAAGNASALAALGISGADIASGKFDTISKQLEQLNPGIPNVTDIVAGMKTSLLSIGSKLPNIGGSIEGLAGNIQSALGNPGTNLSLSDMGKSAVAQFGSLSSSVGSPLNKLMNTAVNSLNDPNAPPYTGTDPIVRARLGLPSVVDNQGNAIT